MNRMEKILLMWPFKTGKKILFTCWQWKEQKKVPLLLFTKVNNKRNKQKKQNRLWIIQNHCEREKRHLFLLFDGRWRQILVILPKGEICSKKRNIPFFWGVTSHKQIFGCFLTCWSCRFCVSYSSFVLLVVANKKTSGLNSSVEITQNITISFLVRSMNTFRQNWSLTNPFT